MSIPKGKTRGLRRCWIVPVGGLLSLVLPMAIRGQESKIPPGQLDPARDAAKLVDPQHRPLAEEYLWTAGDVTALLPNRREFPSRNQDLRVAPHYFRAGFSLPALPQQATFYLAGPRSATLWINGRVAAKFVRDMDQPLGAHVFQVEVTGLLRRGQNVVAIEAVRGRGTVNGNMNDTMVQQAYGEVLVAKLLAGTDALPLLVSDRHWKSSAAAAAGWEQAGFDDSGWKPAFSLGPIESNPDFFQWSADAGLYDWPGYLGMSPQLRTYPLAAVQTSHVYLGGGSAAGLDGLGSLAPDRPLEITLPSADAAEGDPPHLLLDFGREIAGRLYVESAGAEDATISVGYGESEGEALSNQQYLGVNVLRIPAHGTVRGPKSAFRYAYVRFLGAAGPDRTVRLRSLRAEGIAYPVSYRGSFQSSDPELNRIWETSAHTVHLCMQDDVWDAPKRDRGRWIGDLDVEARTIEAAFGDPTPIEQTLARTAADSGDGTRPINGIPGYTALWITTLAQLVRNSGDQRFLEQQSGELHALLRLMESDLDAEHRFTNAKHRWLFVDWSPGLYGFTPEAELGTGLEYVLAFQHAEPLLRLLHDDAGADEVAKQARNMIAELRREHPADDFGARWQINALAVLSGVAADQDAVWRSSLSHVEQEDAAGQVISPYQNYYVLRAMAETGHTAEALAWMKRYWGGMLAEGATSFWESYDLRWPKANPHLSLQADGTSGYFVSLAHGWSTGPLPWMAEYVLGVRPLAEGFQSMEIRPSLSGLEWVSGSVPTPRGDVHVEARKSGESGESMKVKITLPQGETAHVVLPQPPVGSVWRVNGQTAKDSRETAGAVTLLLSTGGDYALEAH